ncbi:hypothetical protein SAICODRAFT_28829 [Saitoella complicata NRRL Y-17804]|uniref:DUF952 domain-containing protein n=1 Tax=Saitoella complicata (strain BCRC 22490 / CBS 7301 / JCM 7358 / NBRC 10748 / NRRL Y-17804) TaxID=698492 RepID=A0A0E9NA67_SAICN|nr:uncharacterized protein SAICODRAFT_28829 [Saitoella complicata NRRL Y-17804]ODQ55812.1 hypothetical protein SAICODRAFT_28829 [Saitoella complicata NRRL Y-17804]GAO46724.1 hypothetical protein G7K_0946-t1 [Saitoella complicata NRRL Y-17804]
MATMSSDESLAPTPLPAHIYKLLPSPPPSPLPPALPVSELDQNDGYIHLSTHTQVPGTASRFFASEKEVWLLKLRYEDVKPHIRWEKSGSGVFPHFYNGLKVGKDKVFDVKGWKKADFAGRDWKEILEEDAWLEA